MRISLLSALFAVSALAGEVPVTPPVYGPAPFTQSATAVASNGDQYLVTWNDYRAELSQVFAARVSGDGTVLDPLGIRVASRPAWNASHVIWSDSSWFVLANQCNGIELVRISAGGAVLDAQPRVFPIAGSCSANFSEATDGRRVAVGYNSVYSDAGNTRYQKHALIIDSDGTLIRDVHLSAGTTETGSGSPMIVWDGSSFVAVWDDHAARFDSGGLRGAARSVLLLGSSSSTLRAASDGRGGVLVIRGGLQYRLTADLAGEYVRPLPFNDVQKILWTGSEYIVFGVPLEGPYQLSKTQLNVVRLAPEGYVLGQQTMRADGESSAELAMATNGHNLLKAWHDASEVAEPYSYPDTYASIVALPALTAEPRKVLSTAARWQLHPLTAAGAGKQLTVWQEWNGIYARRHRRDGAADSAPIRLSAATTAVAFNGADFLTASAEYPALVIRHLPAEGELRVDRESRIDAKSSGAIALAGNGNVMLLAWRDNSAIYAARLAADGSPIDTVPLRIGLARYADSISIAADRDGTFLIVWGGSALGCECSPVSLPEGDSVRAARVTPALTLLDPSPITVVDVSSIFSPAIDPANPKYNPGHTAFADHSSVTYNGEEWLVVWSRSFNVAVNGQRIEREEIRGRRIARNGALLDSSSTEPGILIAPNAFAPAVAWTGSGYVLGWYEGLPYRWTSSPRALQRIHVATFDRPGAPLSNDRILGEAAEVEPISIAIANGFASMAYARLAADARYGGVTRAFVVVPESDSRQRAVR